MAGLEPRLKRFRDLSFFRTPDKELPSTQLSAESRSNSNSRWQPKLTVYRLLVISTTISLGSAKSIAVFNGKSYVSITIEWIAGVAVYTLLFIIGWLEDDPFQYPKLAWLVDCDLIRLIWSLFKKTPNYTSEKRQLIPYSEGTYPGITGYRLLVSGNVFVFGMVKAYCSYVGLGGAANALDWIFGVIITSALYILGLYENNPVNMMPYLFETHYNDHVYSGCSFISKIAQYLSGLAFAVGFSWSWNRILHEMHSGVPVDFLEIYDGTKQVGPPTLFGEVHNMSMRCMMDGLMWLGILMGVGFSLYFLWEMISAFLQLSAFRKPVKLLRHGFLWISKTISRQFSKLDFSTPTWAEGAVDILAKIYRFVRHFGVHVSVFAFAAILCSVPAFFFLGFPFRIFHPTETKRELIVVMVIGILYVFIAGLIGGFFCVGLALSIRQVLRPFFQDLDDPYRERMAFEF